MQTLELEGIRPCKKNVLIERKTSLKNMKNVRYASKVMFT